MFVYIIDKNLGLFAKYQWDIARHKFCESLYGRYKHTLITIDTFKLRTIWYVGMKTEVRDIRLLPTWM